MERARFFPAGDNGLVIKFKDEISESINKRIRAFCLSIEKERITSIIEIIPTYTSILVIYDPLQISYHELNSMLKEIENKVTINELPEAEIIHIPVLYGGDYGCDLANVAKHNSLTEEEVISIHSSSKYLIYMLGFTPGFPYLGGMSEKIATPRLDIPRQKIPSGSVGIAGKQTGIYPIDSPGGWQLIGRTPVKLFDPARNPAVLLKAGQYIHFEPITEARYHEISEQVKAGNFFLRKSSVKGSQEDE